MSKIEEPILMQNQNGALNEDTIAQAEFIKLQKEYGLEVAIETGTCMGYTTDFLAEHYKKVVTIEISPKFHKIAYENRLRNHSHVSMFLGASDLMLNTMLQEYAVRHKTFIFLDAHWGINCPLKEELKQIADSKILPVIAIHDFVVPNHPELGFDSINGQPFTYEWLKPEIDAIYGENNYTHYYNEKAEGAKRGIIYIVPKQ